MKTIVISGKFPSLNEYVESCRRNHYAANNLIQKAEKKIIGQMDTKYRFTPPIVISYTYYECNRRRDHDNVSAFFHKVFQDSLVKSRMLEDDGWKFISGYRDDFRLDKNNPRIEINIYEKGEKI